MHFLEALNLAQHISRTRPSWTIVSIGRFTPLAEIRLGMPWGISVLERGHDKPRVIWQREDLEGPTASMPVGTEAEATNQPGMLF